MLVQKLLRLDDTLIQEVEELAKELSKTEYTSFSALTRKLIRQGLDMETNEKSFIEEIKSLSHVKNDDKNRLLGYLKQGIRESALSGFKSHKFQPAIFVGSNMTYILELAEFIYNKIREDGFDTVYVVENGNLYIQVKWQYSVE